MVDELLSGRVTSFRREQGFGVITLDDGREVKFDASSCTMVPEEGAAVRLRIAPARWGGGFKALHVEPHGSPVMIVPAAPATLDQQVAALAREHLVGGLSEQVMARLIADRFCGRPGDATVLGLVDAYYRSDAASARHDGYVRVAPPFRHDATDLLAEFAAVLPGGAVPRRLAWEPGSAGSGTLRVQLPDGSSRAVAVTSLDDIVALVNHSLAAADDPRRLYALTTGSDWHAWLVLTPDRAARLARVLPLVVGKG